MWWMRLFRRKPVRHGTDQADDDEIHDEPERQAVRAQLEQMECELAQLSDRRQTLPIPRDRREQEALQRRRSLEAYAGKLKQDRD